MKKVPQHAGKGKLNVIKVTWLRHPFSRMDYRTGMLESEDKLRARDRRDFQNASLLNPVGREVEVFIHR